METKQLAKAMAAVGRFANPKSMIETHSKVRVFDDGYNLLLETQSGLGSCRTIVGPHDSPYDGLDIDVILDHSKFAAILRSWNYGEINLESKGNHLLLSYESSRVSLPTVEIPWSVSAIVGVERDSTVEISGKDFRACSMRLRPMSDKVEVEYAQCQRLITDDGKLYFISSTTRAWAASWCEFSGQPVDSMVPIDSMLAAAACFSEFSDTLSLGPSGNNFLISSPQTMVLLPTSSEGRAPMTERQMERVWKNAAHWDVTRQELKDFLLQAGVFVTEAAHGVWLIPQEDGILGKFTGEVCGSHAVDLAVDGTCESLIPGKGVGPPVFASQPTLLPAVLASDDEDFAVWVTNQGITVCSRNHKMGVSQLVQPTT